VNTSIAMVQNIVNTPLGPEETWESRYKDFTFNIIKGFVMKTVPPGDTFNTVFTLLTKPKTDVAAIKNFGDMSQKLLDATQLQIEQYAKYSNGNSTHQAKRAHDGAGGPFNRNQPKRFKSNINPPSEIGGKRSDGKFTCPGHHT
jgi:hypothetical protein